MGRDEKRMTTIQYLFLMFTAHYHELQDEARSESARSTEKTGKNKMSFQPHLLQTKCFLQGAQAELQSLAKSQVLLLANASSLGSSKCAR